MGNTYGDQDTAIKLKAIFQKTTPVDVSWQFPVQSTQDNFVFKATVGRLPAKVMNTFTKPNLNVGFEGVTEQTYFTIDGNHTQSNIALRMKYEDFKIAILKKDGREKNKLLSGIANLFVGKGSKEDSDNFKEGKGNAERDATKSFFNYLWLNVKSGLLKTLS